MVPQPSAMGSTQRLDKELAYTHLHMNKVSNQFKQMMETGDRSVFQATALSSGFVSPQGSNSRKGPFP